MPAPTFTDAGTAKLVELDPSATVTPPVPAGPLKLTVQVDVPAELTEAGLHDRELTVTETAGIVIVPLMGETATEAPASEAPRALATAIGAVVAPLVNVTVTTATTPLEIILELMPEAMQIYAAAPPVHETDLPAAVEAAPAATLTFATLAAGYESVHSTAAGSLPAGEDIERFSTTVLPAVAVPDESVKTDCAHRALPNPRAVAKTAKPKTLDIPSLPPSSGTVNVHSNTSRILAVMEPICLGFKWLAAVIVTKVVFLIVLPVPIN